MRFLIDECLTVELVLDAEKEGYEAHHLVRLGKAGWLDWNIVSYAVDGAEGPSVRKRTGNLRIR